MFICPAPEMAELLVDIYRTKDPYSGLGQFSLNFAEALIAHPRPGQHVTFLRPRGSSLPASGDHDQVQASALMRYLPALHRRYDLWHSLHQFPSHPPRRGCRVMLTVHDLNFLIEKNPPKAQRYLTELQRNLDRASTITAVSNYTRTQLEQHTDLRGKPVHVIYNGVRLDAYPDARRPAFMDDRPFFFAMSVFKEKKNLHTLVPLMEHFPDHQLVIAGNHTTGYGELVRRAIQEAGLEHRIHLPGTVDDRTKYWLYKHCEAFLFPSLAEGFGLPIIEAMSVGTPVFLSRSTSIPEIGGDVAFYFDELTPEHMAATIQGHLRQWRAMGPAARDRAHAYAARFQWADSIRQYQDLYAQLLDG